MATIVERGIDHMFGPEAEDCIYYLTLYNENYPMPALPVPDGDVATQDAAAAALRQAILRGIYRYVGPAQAAGARRPFGDDPVLRAFVAGRHAST